MDSQIEKYIPKGKIYTWKYTERYGKFEAWNFTLDQDGANSLSDLLDLMKESQYPSKKKIATTYPNRNQLDVPNYLNGKAKWESKPNIVFSFKKYEDENYWEIKENTSSIELRFGFAKLRELKKAIQDIPKGKGDYGIYDASENNLLMIWWNLEK
ncbi:hypothetical protein [Marinifilum fragile]|uniref:hypothetical protein n=1 Tax=Marinifilum fragile TaxID=570161 RepID=UPI002AA69B3F|nr:hypothetical protein [Marinifilum fragile]